jgi:hypothetical protein
MTYSKPYCPCPTPSKPVITNSGNNNTHFTQKYMQSVIITNARYKKGGRISNFKQVVNDFGRTTGSPYGYGQPPKNSF